jgi:uncharacterized membrane protein YfcA
MPKLRLVGTGTMFIAVNTVFKLAAYLGLGQFSADGVGTSLVLLPIAVAGNFFGIWLVRITPTELFYKIAYVMVMLISLALLWQGTVRTLA